MRPEIMVLFLNKNLITISCQDHVWYLIDRVKKNQSKGRVIDSAVLIVVGYADSESAKIFSKKIFFDPLPSSGRYTKKSHEIGRHRNYEKKNFD